MNAQEKEELRHAVLECLAARHPAALNLDQIWKRAAKQLDFGFERLEVEPALAVLEDLKLVQVQQDSLGSTRYWSATAAGVLLIERGEARTPQRD
jgi:hypothetical protein